MYSTREPESRLRERTNSSGRVFNALFFLLFSSPLKNVRMIKFVKQFVDQHFSQFSYSYMTLLHCNATNLISILKRKLHSFKIKCLNNLTQEDPKISAQFPHRAHLYTGARASKSASALQVPPRALISFGSATGGKTQATRAPAEGKQSDSRDER